LPTPGTAFLRAFQSGHFVQTTTSAATASKGSFLGKAALSQYGLCRNRQKTCFLRTCVSRLQRPSFPLQLLGSLP
jgi:hypothetical protein